MTLQRVVAFAAGTIAILGSTTAFVQSDDAPSSPFQVGMTDRSGVMGVGAGRRAIIGWQTS